MERKLIQLLDKNLECMDYKVKDDKVVILAKSMQKEGKCIKTHRLV